MNWNLIFGCDVTGADVSCSVLDVLQALRAVPAWPDPDIDAESIRKILIDEARSQGRHEYFTDHAANFIAAVNTFVNAPSTFMAEPHAFENLVMTLGEEAPDTDIYEFPDLAVVARGYVQLKDLAARLRITLKFSEEIQIYLCALAQKEHLVGLPEALKDFDYEDGVLLRIKTENARRMAKVIQEHPQFEDLKDFEDPETYSAARFADIENYANG